MLLAIDVGNTNIVCGVYKEDKLMTTFRLTSKRNRTADEFGLDIYCLLQMAGLDGANITDVIIASVVPDTMYSLTRCIQGYFHVDPLIVSSSTKCGITIAIPNPPEMGADRIVDAAIAYATYGGPIMICDFGTATTYDVVNEKGELFAAITAPGIRTSALALSGETSQLPKIEIFKPDSILAQTTTTSMQAGLVYGYIGSVEYIVRQVRQEMGIPDLKVIATGGIGKIIVKETDIIDHYDKNLTLNGLKLIFDMNAGQR